MLLPGMMVPLQHNAVLCWDFIRAGIGLVIGNNLAPIGPFLRHPLRHLKVIGICVVAGSRFNLHREAIKLSCGKSCLEKLESKVNVLVDCQLPIVFSLCLAYAARSQMTSKPITGTFPKEKDWDCALYPQA
jgi:hypothetical protein